MSRTEEMRSSLLNSIENDLGVAKFSNETYDQHVNRILYSALASWIKTAALDRLSAKIDINKSGVSRRHILEKCSKIFEEFMRVFPQSIPWFHDDKNSPVEILRNRLFLSRDLENVGFDTFVSLSPQKIVSMSTDFDQALGAPYKNGWVYSGVSLVRPNLSGGCSLEKLPKSSVWLEQYVKKAWWKAVVPSNDDLSYFNSHKQSPNNYSCWQAQKPQAVNGLTLLRHPINKNYYEYILQKEIAGDTFWHHLDSFYHEMFEHRRIMFVLRNKAQNAVPATAVIHFDYVQLSLRVHLPNRENTLLEIFTWPHNSISDKYTWNIPFFLWGYIRESLEALGLEVVEVFNG